MFYRFTIERSWPLATLILCWFCCQFEVGQWSKCKSLFLWIWYLLWLGRCERKFTDEMGWFTFCNRGCQSWHKYYCRLGLRNKILLWFHLTRGEVIIQGKWKSWFLQLNNSVLTMRRRKQMMHGLVNYWCRNPCLLEMHSLPTSFSPWKLFFPGWKFGWWDLIVAAVVTEQSFTSNCKSYFNDIQ